MFDQYGEFESSKSAMKPRAPELSALMTILRVVGPVISTRRSANAAGTGAIVKSSGAETKESFSPASSAAWRSSRARSSSTRARVELLVQAPDQGERVFGQHLVVARVERGIDL